MISMPTPFVPNLPRDFGSLFSTAREDMGPFSLLASAKKVCLKYPMQKHSTELREVL